LSGILIFVYQLLGTLAFLVLSPALVLRALRHPEEMRERMGRAPVPDRSGRPPSELEIRPLWLHAASLGELQALRGLLEDPFWNLRPPLLISVLSVSARRRAQGGLRAPGPLVLRAALLAPDQAAWPDPL
jgi:3-deoxy-D-manno-octulosonic-acid transferase